ncbi:hypothetical protein DFJ73DRAFT_827033 [Zopfochytrium polystomum]|nr:hypothetical protein DFJ73DRAFT_827033 [Zopfochytrium polystomum]
MNRLPRACKAASRLSCFSQATAVSNASSSRLSIVSSPSNSAALLSTSSLSSSSSSSFQNSLSPPTRSTACAFASSTNLISLSSSSCILSLRAVVLPLARSSDQPTDGQRANPHSSPSASSGASFSNQPAPPADSARVFSVERTMRDDQLSVLSEALSNSLRARLISQSIGWHCTLDDDN